MKAVFLSFVFLFVVDAAQAQVPDNNATGATVVAPGFACDTCAANISAAPMKPEDPRRQDSQLPSDYGPGDRPEKPAEGAKGVGG